MSVYLSGCHSAILLRPISKIGAIWGAIWAVVATAVTATATAGHRQFVGAKAARAAAPLRKGEKGDNMCHTLILTTANLLRASI